MGEQVLSGSGQPKVRSQGPKHYSPFVCDTATDLLIHEGLT